MANTPEQPDEGDERGAPAQTVGELFRVQLPNFEGPLDLLLHLIKEHKLDVFDIPIALITEKYLSTLDVMRQLNLDVAGEFILMAATLAHLKSRMLLPRMEAQGPDVVEEEVDDPREELVRRLLEYQKYKGAADTLGEKDVLDRDVFARRALPPEAVPVAPESLEGLVEISVFKLIEAFDQVMKKAKVEISHEVLVERTNISDAIAQLAEKLRVTVQISFFELFEGSRDKSRLVVTFLAILEMTRLKLIKIFQEQPTGDIVIRTASGKPLDVAPEVNDEYA
jgi:segregation and condensation protein A